MTTRRAAAAVALWLAALSISCAPSETVRSWRSPTFRGPAFRKVLVVWLAAPPNARRVYEDALVARLVTRGVQGIPSYSLFPGDPAPDDNVIRRAATRSGADAFLVTRTVTVRREPTIVPPEPGVWERIQSAWPGTYKPQVVGQTEILTLETTLFPAAADQPAGSVTTRTYDAADLRKAVPATVRTIVQDLARQGLI